MLQRFQETARFRVLFSFSLVHLGLLLAIFGTARLSVSSGFDLNLILLLSGLLLLYLGTIFGAFFIIWPLIPLIKHAQEARSWWREMDGDLPRYLDLLRKAFEFLRPLIKEWSQGKSAGTADTPDGEARQ